ncbi:hypothetical protein NDU88_002509 [Pleurodeles waltl]|uniref:Uncharacterized protein n=1 Tax=Pleurodeles waltl TaxID=8319 RepID=A0AAV7W2L2_PLEWA|nr:hypothetical protein NDU88_002509 [Pleurodeles waltl]
MVLPALHPQPCAPRELPGWAPLLRGVWIHGVPLGAGLTRRRRVLGRWWCLPEPVVFVASEKRSYHDCLQTGKCGGLLRYRRRAGQICFYVPRRLENT